MSSLHDFEYERLKRKYPGLDPEDVVELQALLDGFVATKNYDFLRKLQIAQFCKGEWISGTAFEVLSFEDLVVRGALNICSSMELQGEDLKGLNDVLRRFVDAESIPEKAVPRDLSAEAARPHISEVRQADNQIRPAKKIDQDLKHLNSIEAERLLTEALDSLRRSPQLGEFASKKVSEFWDHSLISAPFIESLTLKELSQMRPEILLKKRSFNVKKIHGVVRLAEKLLSVPIAQKQSSPRVINPTETREQGGLHLASSRNQPADWKIFSDTLSFTEHCVCALFRENIPNSYDSEAEGWRLFVNSLPDSLPLDSLARAAMLERYGKRDALKLSDCSWSYLKEVFDETLTLLRIRFQFCAPDLFSEWTEVLSSPAVSLRLFEERTFSQEYSVSTRETESLLLRLVLLALGAKSINKGDVTFWTKDSDSFERAVRALLPLLPLSEQKARSVLLQSFPLCSSEEHRAILSSCAQFDRSKKRWTLVSAAK